MSRRALHKMWDAAVLKGYRAALKICNGTAAQNGALSKIVIFF